MPTNNEPVQPAATGAADGSRKRPYLKPAFRHETVFEVTALACGKISATAGPCIRNRKNS
jgi:hypothetical protein